MALGWKRYLSWGSGAGIEIGADRLKVSIVKVRPSAITEVGSLEVENFHERPAAEWGLQYSEFLRKHGVAHLAAVALLPRRDVIVRLVNLPGVEEKDLASAVGYQLDTLHPYSDEDAVAAWGRLGETPEVVVGVARKQVFDSYSSLFAEAGVKISSFTFSPAVFYTSLRLVNEAPKEFLAVSETLSGLEVYGESQAKPLYSSIWDSPAERAVSAAAADLRLNGEVEPYTALPTASFAAAATGAVPFPALSVNLLPESLRRNTSIVRYIPSGILAASLAALLAGIWLHEPYDTGKYTKELQAEIGKVDKRAAAIGKMDQEIESVRERTALLDEFRRRTKSDLDLLLNVTNTIAQPAYLNYYEVNRDTATLGGEAEQAAPLLRVLDASPYLKNSEFQMGIMRMGVGESFRIRSQRRTPVAGQAPVVAAAPATPQNTPPAVPAPVAAPPPVNYNLFPMAVPGAKR